MHFRHHRQRNGTIYFFRKIRNNNRGSKSTNSFLRKASRQKSDLSLYRYCLGGASYQRIQRPYADHFSKSKKFEQRIFRFMQCHSRIRGFLGRIYQHRLVPVFDTGNRSSSGGFDFYPLLASIYGDRGMFIYRVFNKHHTN